ncbi:hypothetical protein PFDG_04820 [Plasmodium falciparum Dd2]|uniref:Uncharacterized protein n=1 Tax=Plasmodium falciparum (isolate Dd2) TaxID=57267 RepID=A0A0L7M8U3_PLAF4|nr:hypothetical protein PFDG_04820 [Plasmodium falciparum Dd2]
MFITCLHILYSCIDHKALSLFILLFVLPILYHYLLLYLFFITTPLPLFFLFLCGRRALPGGGERATPPPKCGLFLTNQQRFVAITGADCKH